MKTVDVWEQLSQPLPDSKLQSIVDRLQQVAVHEWDVTLQEVSVKADAPYGIKARLTVFGVVREQIGTHDELAQAAARAIVGAAWLFGIRGPVRGDGGGAKTADPRAPLTEARQALDLEPANAVAHQLAREEAARYAEPVRATASNPATKEAAAERHAATQADVRRAEGQRAAGAALQDKVDGTPEERDCPVCSGKMWDNRATKRNPRAPDFKCRDRSCDGVIWPPREGKAAAPAKSPAKAPVNAGPAIPGLDYEDDDDLEAELAALDRSLR